MASARLGSLQREQGQVGRPVDDLDLIRNNVLPQKSQILFHKVGIDHQHQGVLQAEDSHVGEDSSPGREHERIAALPR